MQGRYRTGVGHGALKQVFGGLSIAQLYDIQWQNARFLGVLFKYSSNAFGETEAIVPLTFP